MPTRAAIPSRCERTRRATRRPAAAAAGRPRPSRAPSRTSVGRAPGWACRSRRLVVARAESSRRPGDGGFASPGRFFSLASPGRFLTGISGAFSHWHRRGAFSLPSPGRFLAAISGRVLTGIFGALSHRHLRACHRRGAFSLASPGRFLTGISGALFLTGICGWPTAGRSSGMASARRWLAPAAGRPTTPGTRRTWIPATRNRVEARDSGLRQRLWPEPVTLA